MTKWREILRSNFRNLESLCDFLLLSEDQRKKIYPFSSFPLNLPLRLAEKIEKGSLTDPILLQFVPLCMETEQVAHFSFDPLQERSVATTSRLLEKYSGRSLLISTSSCAMNCRFCFRRHFDYPKGTTSFEQEIQALLCQPHIQEAILSGGDPLSLPNERLTSMIQALNHIPHIQRIRFHTRFPIGIPERIDHGLLRLLQSSRAQIWFVLHCNHPRELDAEVQKAMESIRKLGIPVLNQAVLLKGVNDSVQTLVSLCETLINAGITPYYLHQMDRVQGAAHFEVDPRIGLKLIEELRKQLPGYAIPQYVQEVPAQLSKIPVQALLQCEGLSHP